MSLEKLWVFLELQLTHKELSPRMSPLERGLPYVFFALALLFQQWWFLPPQPQVQELALVCTAPKTPWTGQEQQPERLACSKPEGCRSQPPAAPTLAGLSLLLAAAWNCVE